MPWISLTFKPSEKLPRVVSWSGYQGVCLLRDKQNSATMVISLVPGDSHLGSVSSLPVSRTPKELPFFFPSQTLGERRQDHWAFGNTHFSCIDVAVGVGFILTAEITVRPHLLNFHVTPSLACWSVTPL